MGKWRPHEPEGGRQLHAQGETWPPFLHTSRHPSFSGYNAVNEAGTPGWGGAFRLCADHDEGLSRATGLTAWGFTWPERLCWERGREFPGLSQKTVKHTACALRGGQPGWSPWQLPRRACVLGMAWVAGEPPRGWVGPAWGWSLDCVG